MRNSAGVLLEAETAYPSRAHEFITGYPSRAHEFILLVFYVVVFFAFVLYLVCPMLPMSLDCLFLIAPSVFSYAYLHV